MNRKAYSTLVKFAENITQAEMFQAPELPALIALDANLLAVVNLLEFQNPPLCNPEIYKHEIEGGAEEHIADSICFLANALRKNLSAYHAVFHENSASNKNQEEVEF
jgi:hypothetical protein